MERTAEQQDLINSELISAANRGDLPAVKAALKNGANIHANDDVALCSAAANGHFEIVALLLENGANIHAKDDHALCSAATHGHFKMVALLLENGANIHAGDDYALYFAAQGGHLETVALLLENGANIHANDDVALRLAATRGHFKMVALLLENGANIHAKDDHALCSAATHGHFEIVALLLENGANIHANNDYALRCAAAQGYFEMVALLESHDGLEAAIRSYAEKAKAPSLRTLVYQAAVVGALHGMDKTRLVEFVQGTMQQNAYDTPLSRADKRPRPIEMEQFAVLDHQSRNQLDSMAKKIKLDGYLKAAQIPDMVSEYADAVMLPRLLLEEKNGEGQWDDISENQIQRWSEKLLPLAAQEMLGAKRLDEILEMSKAWHINGNSLPHDLRPHLSDRWQQLINDVPTPFEHEGEKLVIRALSDKSSLKRESTALKHCVGQGSHYINQCAAGNIHILSVQTESGTPLATREVILTGNPKEPLEQRQFHGKNNGAVPPLAQQAMDWFDKQLANKEIAFNPPQNGKWGTVTVEKSKPAIIRHIGYEPSAAQVEKCLKHYEQHLLLKQPQLVRNRRDGAFTRPPELTDDYRWVNSIRADAPPAKSDGRQRLV